MVGMKITIAHSPDADDAFMFYGLASGQVDTGSHEISHELVDIQTLNELAMDSSPYEVTAVSYAAYPHIQDRYQPMATGSSMGDNYGPTVIVPSDSTATPEDIAAGELVVAVPGLQTSAYVALKMYAPEARSLVCPFDRIQAGVLEGELAAGLIIHEGQITYERDALRKLVNLGEWWYESTQGLPLPLGTNVVRRDLDEGVRRELAGILRDSIAWALHDRQRALDYALQYGRGLAREDADRFIGMYVNDLTMELGPRGKAGVQEFFERYLGADRMPRLDFLEAPEAATR
jgi:1,4-dihydroxy-6-naphthoate synthase